MLGITPLAKACVMTDDRPAIFARAGSANEPSADMAAPLVFAAIRELIIASLFALFILEILADASKA